MERAVTKADEETDLDVVKLMKCLKDDSDDLFFVCINNQPKLEKHVLHEIFKRVETSQKIRHVSLAMTGITDDDVKVRGQLRNAKLQAFDLPTYLRKAIL